MSDVDPKDFVKSYPPHLLVSFGGYLGDDSTQPEEWSCGLRVVAFDGNGIGGIAIAPKDVDREAQQNYLEDVAPFIKAFMSRVNSQITSQAKLTYIKVNAIKPNGKYLFGDLTSAEYFPAIPGAVTSGAEFKPLQVARVVTLRTAGQRGLSSRGRIYLPCPAGGVDINGVSGVNSLAVAESVQTLLNSMNINDAANTYRVSVVSGGSVKFHLPGTSKVVRSVEVGNVLDTQRRRREDVPEVKLSKPINFGVPNSQDPA